MFYQIFSHVLNEIFSELNVTAGLYDRAKPGVTEDPAGAEREAEPTSTHSSRTGVGAATNRPGYSPQQFSGSQLSGSQGQDPSEQEVPGSQEIFLQIFPNLRQEDEPQHATRQYLPSEPNAMQPPHHSQGQVSLLFKLHLGLGCGQLGVLSSECSRDFGTGPVEEEEAKVSFQEYEETNVAVELQ